MHGDILDANSTNKLIDQSVKDAIDNSIENDNYVTKDLLEAETNARTKSDEDLSAKIKAEQTRAEGKEKEISDKLAIVDGDSNTEGSFRKAIADVIANEVSRATGVENDLRTAIGTKADATALSNYVLTTALNQQIDTLNAAKADRSDLITLEQKVTANTTAIEGKQDKITVNSVDVTDIETADITKLRTIVIDLIDVLSTSGLIRQNSNLE